MMSEIDENTPDRSIVLYQASEAIDLADVAFSIYIINENMKQIT